MRRLISRTAACFVSVTVALGAAAVPCTAGDAIAAKAGSLTRLSPASRALLASAPTAVLSSPSPTASLTLHRSDSEQPQPPAATPSSPSSFFSTTRGKVTLALMGAGAGLALWSVHHDRQPVKSPIR